jgi:colicin import membrane protein
VNALVLRAAQSPATRSSGAQRAAERASAPRAEQGAVEMRAAAQGERVAAQRASAPKAEQGAVEMRAAAQAGRAAEQPASAPRADQRAVEMRAAAQGERVAEQPASAPKAEQRAVEMRAAAQGERVAAQRASAPKAEQRADVQARLSSRIYVSVRESPSAQICVNVRDQVLLRPAEGSPHRRPAKETAGVVEAIHHPDGRSGAELVSQRYMPRKGQPSGCWGRAAFQYS